MIVNRFTTEKLGNGRWQVTLESPLTESKKVVQTFATMDLAYDWLGVLILRSKPERR